MNIKQILKNKFYAESPFDLASEEDDKYRNAVDGIIDSDFIENVFFMNEKNER